MDIINNPAEILAELDRLRIACGMSYQDVADACGVSKSTIHRTLSGAVEPTVHLVNLIAAAVQYKPPMPDILPSDTDYLKQLIVQLSADHDRHVQQLHAHYNRQLRQNKREKLVWMVLSILLVGTFVVLFLYDFSHLDRGWIQAAAEAGLLGSGFSRALLYVRSLMGVLPWAI